jgi:hypothetical protein
MNTEQFKRFKEEVKEAVAARPTKQNINGEIVTIVALTDQSKYLKEDFKGRKLFKISVQQFNHTGKSFTELLNTSTGVVAVGGESKPKRDWPYESEDFDGLFSHLKSKPEKKYIVAKWRNEGVRAHNGKVYDPVFIDEDGQVIDNPYDLMKEKPQWNPTVVTPNGHKEAVEVKTEIRVYGIDSIVSMKVAGCTVVDDELSPIQDIIKDMLI